MNKPAVVVDDVSKMFRIYHERNQSLKAALMRGRRAKYDEFWALKDVSLEIASGQTYGLVRHNGSGKSTLLKTMAKILRPDSGAVETNGKVSALLELGAGFHPELSGRDNVYLNGSILGLSKREIDAKFDDIVGFAGLEDFVDQPVKNYSSGMYVRRILQASTYSPSAIYLLACSCRSRTTASRPSSSCFKACRSSIGMLSSFKRPKRNWASKSRFSLIRSRIRSAVDPPPTEPAWAGFHRALSYPL